MPDEVIIDAPVIVEAANPFGQDAWKTEVTAVNPTVTDPVIKEKDENIKPDDTVVKPDEPGKIPAATPKPIQDRPADDNAQPKDIVKPDTEIKTEPLKFANETSEKIYNAIRDGKIEELEKHFEEKSRLTKADGAEAIRLQLAYDNKEFTTDEVTDLFNEKYNIPEKPEQSLTETDSEFEDREAKYKEDFAKYERRIARDAKLAKVELNKITQELVLPDIPKTPDAPIEPTQEELDAQKKALDEFLQAAENGIKNFNGYETTFKDEEVQLNVAYKPTEEEMKAIEPLLAAAYSDAPEFLKKLGWFNKEGNFDVAKLTADLHILLNRDKVINDLVSEAANQRYAEVKRTHKNIDFSGQKRSGNLNPTPAEEGKKMATHFFQN